MRWYGLENVREKEAVAEQGLLKKKTDWDLGDDQQYVRSCTKLYCNVTF